MQLISRGTNPVKFRREEQHHERHRKLCYNHSIANIHPFEDNPYKVQDNEEMQFLCESIRENGVLSPLLVRKIGAAEEYKVISGHRRLYAAHKLGLTELPTVTTDLDRNAAAIALVDSNLHREHILPSEKAFAYKLKMEALSHQGAACGQADHKSRDAVSDTDSGRQVQRYIRLTYLIPELLNKLDTGEVALSIGVELSYLDEQRQRDVLEQCEINACTPSYPQSVRLKKLFQNQQLTSLDIQQILSEEKPNQQEVMKISAKRLQAVLPQGLNAAETEDYAIKACEHYRKFQRRREQER